MVILIEQALKADIYRTLKSFLLDDKVIYDGKLWKADPRHGNLLRLYLVADTSQVVSIPPCLATRSWRHVNIADFFEGRVTVATVAYTYAHFNTFFLSRIERGREEAYVLNSRILSSEDVEAFKGVFKLEVYPISAHP
jgi:hypothetical protein